MRSRGADTFDVIVAGFGGAGASAAIEAAAHGASVLIIDRFRGGGATAMSGGVVYAGGGTELQVAAGYTDPIEDMIRYVEMETDGRLPPEVVWSFCERSGENLEWLRRHGVPFPPTGEAIKTSYPPDHCTLYFSGNEQAAPFRDATPAAPRGHRALGKGLTGNVLYSHLGPAAERVATVRRHCRATRLLTDDTGRITGIEYRRIVGGPPVRGLHRLFRLLATYVGSISRPLGTFLQALLVVLERWSSRTHRSYARGGVVLATGGFGYNPALMRRYAPSHARNSLRLGHAGDMGDGIGLGLAVGAGLADTDKCCAIRFIDPPHAFTTGVLIDDNGARVCNEELYGSTIGNALAEPMHGGRGWLVVDDAQVRLARRQMRGKDIDLFQKVFGRVNLLLNRKRARTLAELGRVCGMAAGVMERAVERYNLGVEHGHDATGKHADRQRAVTTGPFTAIRMDLDAILYPAPTFTLGGLRTDPLTGRVRRDDGSFIDGLYAAGRAAAGVSSAFYVSGISLADCVFSGRNAGEHASTRSSDLDEMLPALEQPTVAVDL